MGRETSIGSMSALAVTFDIAEHEVPCFRLLSEWWGARARRGRAIKEPRACPSKLRILEGALRAVGSFMLGAERLAMLRIQPRMLDEAATLTSYVKA